MVLKSQVEWVLHCCAILASLPEDRTLSTKALAEFHGVPKEYLSKALQSLSQAGIVEGSLGPTGGYRLLKPAEDISFLDIIEAVEGRKSTFVCTNIRANNPCRPAEFCDAQVCPVARVMWDADEAWRERLRGVKLSDLVNSVGNEVPSELLNASADWILERAG